MAESGWQTLGNVLGGGIDRAGAFETGRLRTAQTESALQLARERQLKNIAAEKQAAAIDRLRLAAAESGIDSVAEGASGVDTMEAGFANFDQLMGGRLKGQEYDNREILANPEAPLGDAFRAGWGVQGKVLPRYEVEGGLAQDLLGEQQGVFANPVGESTIAANEALTNLRNVQAGDPDYRNWGSPGSGGDGPGGLKAPTNFMPNPTFDKSQPMSTANPPFVPIPGSPADPNAPAAPGSREATFNERVFAAVAQTIPDVTNMLLLPSTANTGVFGVGARPGKSVTQASIDALRNTLSGEVVRAYEQQVQQLGRNLAQIESNGLQPSSAFINSYENLVLRPGSTGFDALRSFANIRQTIDQAIRVKMANPRVPSDQKALLQQFSAEIQKSIPFTVEDVQKLQFGDGRYRTMADVVKEKGLGGVPAAPGASAAPSAPAAPTPQGAKPGANFPMKNAKGWPKLKDGNGNYAYVGPNGEIEEITSGL